MSKKTYNWLCSQKRMRRETAYIYSDFHGEH